MIFDEDWLPLNYRENLYTNNPKKKLISEED